MLNEQHLSQAGPINPAPLYPATRYSRVLFDWGNEVQMTTRVSVLPRLTKVKKTRNKQKSMHNQGVNPPTDGFHLTPSSVARVKSRALLTGKRKQPRPSYKSLNARDL